MNRPYPRRSQDFSANGKTQQHFKESCDVNNIVAHFTQTGIDPHADRIGKQKFGYASSQSFSEALRATAEINSAFAELPSATRAHFQNDPASWLDAQLTPEAPSEEITPPESPQEPSTAPTPTPDTPESGSETA